MRSIVLLGSTGSIGTQTLDVVRNNKDELKVIGLAANKRVSEVACRMRTFSGVMSPRMRTARPGPGNGWRVMRCSGIPS